MVNNTRGKNVFRGDPDGDMTSGIIRLFVKDRDLETHRRYQDVAALTGLTLFFSGLLMLFMKEDSLLLGFWVASSITLPISCVIHRTWVHQYFWSRIRSLFWQVMDHEEVIFQAHLDELIQTALVFRHQKRFGRPDRASSTAAVADRLMVLIDGDPLLRRLDTELSDLFASKPLFCTRYNPSFRKVFDAWTDALVSQMAIKVVVRAERCQRKMEGR